MNSLQEYKLARALRYRARIKQAQEKGDSQRAEKLSKILETIERDILSTSNEKCTSSPNL